MHMDKCFFNSDTDSLAIFVLFFFQPIMQLQVCKNNDLLFLSQENEQTWKSWKYIRGYISY